LEAFKKDEGDSVNYNPEVFPAVFMDSFEKITMLIYSTGMVILTGSSCRTEIRESFLRGYAVIVKYRQDKLENEKKNSASQKTLAHDFRAIESCDDTEKSISDHLLQRLRAPRMEDYVAIEDSSCNGENVNGGGDVRFDDEMDLMVYGGGNMVDKSFFRDFHAFKDVMTDYVAKLDGNGDDRYSDMANIEEDHILSKKNITNYKKACVQLNDIMATIKSTSSIEPWLLSDGRRPIDASEKCVGEIALHKTHESSSGKFDTNANVHPPLLNDTIRTNSMYSAQKIRDVDGMRKKMFSMAHDMVVV
jgi:hypothetical protein